MRKVKILLALVTFITVVGAGAVRAQESPDTSAISSYNLGIQAEQKGDTVEAITYYQAAVMSDPEYADAYYNMGSIFFAQAKYEKAAENFKRVTEINPSSAEGFASYGKVLFAQSKYDQAIEAFQGALAADADFKEALKELGKLYFKKATQSSASADQKKYYNESISKLNQYVIQDASDAYSFYLLGMAYKRLKSYDKAIENLAKAVTIDPGDFESVYSLAGIYLALERYSQATDQYEKALKIKPKDYHAAYNLAIAIQSSNPENYDAAISAWERFLQVARKNTDSRAKKYIEQAESLIAELKKAKAGG